MAKNLNVNLTFTANTQQAKMQLQQLQTQLSQLTTNSAIGQNLTKDIQQGITAASQLKTMLQSATDVDTGKLNLSQFNQSLQQSGLKLGQFGDRMAALGPQGKQAFQEVARSIANAQVPIRATNTMLDKMWTTMANTMRWQISASVLQGFTSTISNAYQYAQDLNESLNNIRIVTGYSVDEMSKFAVEANNAAKALSTTTTEYTNAALIYYQQGLNSQEVKERTDVTVKMANVARESADTVSDWMTAIWNNFDNGSKSLEYYADVVTALGAATASSSDEIATGLEKFAAVADTVGLSYEYATAALATVTATTRQSADIVGTAFKTLFARMQDLKLGETLEDGTTLGQYSEAMLAVGVNIKDATGNLKDMDVILDELGVRWKSLDKDQQVALAKSVAGLRQYNQFIALMSNYDYFKQNVTIAETATGELTKQADIFAESWEAANNRVKAAAEDLYDDLLKDDFFINLTDGFASLLNGLGEVINAMGGLKGLLPLLFVGFTKLFGEKMLVGIRDFSNSMKLSSASAQQQALATKQTALNLMQQFGDETSQAGTLEIKELELQKKIYDINRLLSEEEQKQVQLWFDQLSAIRQVVAELEGMSAEGVQQQQSFDDAVAEAGALSRKGKPIYGNAAENRTKNQAQVLENANYAMREAAAFDAEMGPMDSEQALWDKIQASEHDFAGAADIKNANKADVIEYDEKINKWKLKNNALDKEAEIQTKKITSAYEGYNEQIDNFDGLLRDKIEGMKKDAKATIGVNEATELYDEQLEKTSKNIQNMQKVPLSNSIMATAQSVSSLAMGISSLSSGLSTLWEGIQTGELTFSDFTSVLMSLGMGLPMLLSGFSGLQSAIGGILSTNVLNNQSLLVSNILLMRSKKLTEEQAAMVIGLKMAKDLENGETEENVLAMGAELLMKKLGKTQDEANTISTMLLKGAKDKETQSRWANVVAMNAEKLAAGPVMWIVLAIVAAVALATAGFVALFKHLEAGSPESRLKAEEERLQKINEALEESKTKYNELKSAIEDYSNAKSALDAMVEGTDQWKQAVSDLNDQILQLVEQYPELQKYVKLENGILTIDEADFNKVLKSNETVVNELQQSQIAQQISVAERRSTVNVANNKKALGSTVKYDDETQETTTFKTSGGQTALISGTSGTTERFYNQMTKLYDQFGNELFIDRSKWSDELKIATENMSSSWMTALDTLATDSTFQEIITSNEQLTTQISQLSIAMAAYTLENNAEYQKSEYKDAVSTQYSKAFTDAITNKEITTDSGVVKKDEWLKDYLIWQYSESDSGHGDVRGNEYIKQAGLEGIETQEDLAAWIVSQETGVNVDKIGASGAGLEVDLRNIGGDTIEYKKKDSDTWETIDYEEYQEQLWSKYVNQHLDKQVAEMSERALEYGNGLLAAGVTAEQAKGLVNDFVSGNTMDLTGMTREQIYSLDASKISDSKDLTDEEKEKLKTGLDTAIQEYETAIRDANLQASQAWIEEKAQREAEELQKALTDADMDTEDFEDYVKALEKANPELAEHEGLSKKLAKDNLLLTNSLGKVEKVLSEQADALATADKESAAYVSAINDISGALQEWLGVKLDDETIQQFQEDGTLQRAINGSADAIKELQMAAAEQVVLDMDIKGLTNDQGVNYFDELNKKINEVKNNDIKIGATLDSTDFVNTLNEMLKTGAVTAEQMSGYLNSIGYEPDITYTTTTQSHTTKGKINLPLIGERDFSYTVDEEVKIPVINAKGTQYTGGGKKTTTPASASADKTKADNIKDKSKKSDEEIERYHEINELMDDMSREMDKLSKAKDRAFGADKVELINQEIKALEAEAKAQDELIRQTEYYLALDKKNLSAYGAKFDEAGRITNYDEMYAAQMNKYNAAIATGNDETIEKAEEDYANFEKYISQYEDTLNKLEDEQEERLDQDIQIFEKKLEAIDVSIEVNIELNDRQIKNLQRLLDDLDDDAFDGASRIQKRTEMIGEEFKNIEKYTEGIDKTLTEALKKNGVTDEAEQKKIIDAYKNGNVDVLKGYEFDQNTIDQLTEYTDGLTDSYQNIKTLRKEIEDEVLTTFEAQREEIEKNGEAFGHAAAMVGHYKNIIDTIGKSKLGLDDAILKDLNDAKDMAAKGDFDIAASQMRTTQAALNEAKDALAGAKTKHDKEYWQDVVDNLTTQLREDTEGVAEAWSNYLTTITDSFNENMQNTLNTFEDTIAGINHKSLDALADSFNKEQEIADMYLADYKKIYELSKLNRNIQNSLETTDNVKAQKALRELQEEINEYQKNGKQMSEYELSNLQKKYDLRLAEIALEEAQNAKSVVRLQRDSEGNYGYVYTADQNQVDDAQQKYEDALYSMQENNDNYLEQLQSDIISNRQAMVEELRNLDISDYANAEEYYAARDSIIQHYKDKEKIMLDQLGIVIGNNKTLYEDDWSNYSAATGYKISSNEAWVTNFGQTELALQTGYGHIKEFAQGLHDAIGNADTPGSLIYSMNENYKDWQVKFDEIMKLAGGTLGTFSTTAGDAFVNGEGSAKSSAEAFKNALLTSLYGEGGTAEEPKGGIVGGMNDATNSIGDVEDKAKTSFANAVISAGTFQTEWSPKIEAAKTPVDNLNTALNNLIGMKSQEISVTTNKKIDETQQKLQNIINSLAKIVDKDITVTVKKVESDDDDLKIADPPKENKRITVKNAKGDDAKDFVDDKGNVWVQGSDNLWYNTNWEGHKNEGLKDGYYTHTWEAGTTGLTYAKAKGYKDEIKETVMVYTPEGNISNSERIYIGKNGKFYLQSEGAKIAENRYINGGIARTFTSNNAGTVSSGKGFSVAGDLSGRMYFKYKNNTYVKHSSADIWYKLSSKKDVWGNYNVSAGDKRFKFFDTGGYTGEWGPEGRLAMLHQKEIVLNAHDTENLLTAVDLVRSMATKLEANALATRQGLAGFASAIIPTSGGDVLEQNVKIEASFPNATDRNEIEAAFGDLVNLAAQYANRK